MLRQLTATSVVVILAVVAIGYFWRSGPAGCAVCQRPLHQATFYEIRLADETRVDVCCTRCGLHYQSSQDDVAAVRVADFSTGALLEADRATYVEGSEVHLCCLTGNVQEDRSGTQYDLAWDRCLPSLVAFQSLTDAIEFQGANGGRLRTYADLLAEEQAAAVTRP